MTTSAKDAPLIVEQGLENAIGIIDNDIVYEGSAVGDNGAGYGRPLVAGDLFCGFAKDNCDNTGAGHAAGAKNMLLLREGVVKLTLVSVAITDIGEPVYASDDATFTMVGAGTSSGNSFVGIIVRYIDSTHAMVAFGPKIKDPFPNPPATRILKSADYTALITDSGKVIYVDTTTKIIAMTAIATLLSGFELTIVNAGVGILIEVDPNGSEVMSGGCGLAAGTAGQKLSNTAATAKRGDYVKLAGNATGWTVIGMRGTWVMA